MRQAWIPYLAVVTSLTACLTKENKCTTGHVRQDGLCVADNASTVGGRGRDDDAGRDVRGPDRGDAALDAAVQDCFLDYDGDGFGVGKPVECIDSTTADGGPAGVDGAVEVAQATKDGDCDDREERRAPGLMEACDGIDNDCDTEIDEDIKNACGGPCTRPLDHVPGTACTNGLLGACTRSAQYVCQGDSAVVCDAPTASPSSELCGDQVDNDCDGQTNEADAADAPTWYQDCDGDGYAASTEGALRSCLKPALTEACSWTTVVPQPATKTNWDCNDSSKKYSPAIAAYGLPADGSASFDLNCNGTADKDPGVTERDGTQHPLCRQPTVAGCGYWKDAAGENIVTQPACSASATSNYRAAYWACNKGTIAMPPWCGVKTIEGLQHCR